MTLKLGLTDKQQAYIMFFALLLGLWSPIIESWLYAGASTTPLALAVLFGALLASFTAAVLAFLKEVLGITVPTTSQQTQTPPKTAVTRTPALYLKKRLMFLAYLK